MANCKLPHHVNHIDTVNYIHELQLHGDKIRYGVPQNRPNITVPVLSDAKQDAYVVAGGIAAFTENVKGQAKQDILNATLLAQLASNKKFDRERSTEDWYREYSSILGKIGFVTEDFMFERYEASGASFKMDEAVLEIIAAVATANEVAIVQATLDALRTKSDSDKSITLFDSHGSHSSSGNFQIYPCDQAPDGEVSLKLAAFYFKGSQKDGNFLFFSWSTSQTNLYKGVQRLVLNSDVYSNVRSTVAAKLGANAIDLISSIEI